MKKNATKIIFGFLLLLLCAGIGYWIHVGSVQSGEQLSVSPTLEKKLAQSSGEEGEGIGNEREESKERDDYFFRLVRNPATNAIPKNIRSRELNHARKLPTHLQILQSRNKGQAASAAAKGFKWQLAGPPAVGGRTRALGIDQRNSDIIIAGGVSGGIWKSTDGGDSWDLKTPDFENFSVTSLAQDPTQPDTWYYTAGELIGNSAAGRNRSASYYGTGIFRSTNNGDSWSRIPGTKDVNAQFDTQFDYVHRVVVSPTTGTVFTANNGFGIFRSPNGNNFNDLVLGGAGQHYFADVTVATDGTVAAVLSSFDAGSSGGNPGIFVSQDDGRTWSEVTPPSFPSTYYRSVLSFAPSNPEILYVFTSPDDPFSQDSPGIAGENPKLFKLNLAQGTAEDQSANLPNFGGQVGFTATQNSYDMTIAVKPDDPNFVTVGGIDLFRSADGFATGPTGNSASQKDKYWIGGYNKTNDVSNYPNQHADQQVQVYDPNNPDRLWVGHDGGLSLTSDVTANSVSWQDKNKGYIVTQFYDASIGTGKDDNRVTGGTQDNGTPYFTLNSQQKIGNASSDISSGDGGFSFFTKNYIYSSNALSGLGISRVIRFDKDLSDLAYVQPAQATPALFINPYIVDPNNEGIMYYASGSGLYRNTSVDKITNNDSDGASQGWTKVNGASLSGYNISAFAVSTFPRNILYYAGSNTSNRPVIKRLNNANTSDNQPTDISIPKSAVPDANISGAFVHNIAVNPANGNDVLVVMSNYDIVGLYHTTNGGDSWQAVEGNLTGVNDSASPDQGPSIRSATIIPAKSGPIYLLGTSTGVYSTRTLNGQNTQWARESATKNDGKSDIGFSVVEDITSRLSDGDVVVGSHGRGMFVGRFQGSIANIKNLPSISINPTQGFGGNPTINENGDKITITAQNFQFTKTDSVFFDGVSANIITTSFPTNKLTVYVPRIPIPQNAKLTEGNYNVTIKVKRNGQNLTASFSLLSPQTNGLSQNYPNPFQHATSIPVDVAQKSHVKLSIYSTSGQQVYQSKDQVYSAGTHNIPVDFSGKASGIYIYRVMIDPTGSGDTFTDSKKFTFIK